MTVPAPLHSDWSWRPEPWSERLPEPELSQAVNRSRFGAEVGVFHDGREAEILVRQGAAPAPPHPVEIVIGAFSGSFLSLAVDLPAKAVTGLRRRHLIRAGMRLDAAPAASVFARLNIRNGPNTEVLTQTVGAGDSAVVEFELFHTRMDESRVEAAWFDLIFADPVPGPIVIADLTLSRRPRAEV